MSEEGFRAKLIAAKEAWAKSGRLLTGTHSSRAEQRLPPGQRLVSNWPVLDLGVQPDVPKAAWNLVIDGAVDTPLTWGWEAYLSQPQVEFTSDIHCVTQWSRYDNQWVGVSLAHIAEAAAVRDTVRHVLFHGYDGYTTNVSMEQFLSDGAMLAHLHDGQEISREHGGPVRVVIPDWYFWKSAKWIARIEFLESDQPGFWEVRGYHNEGDPWREERYSL